MSLPTHSSTKLAHRIKHAIEDCRLTRAEYEEIHHMAHEDQKIDPQEKVLLDELMLLVDNGTVKLVAE